MHTLHVIVVYIIRHSLRSNNFLPTSNSDLKACIHTLKDEKSKTVGYNYSQTSHKGVDILVITYPFKV